MNDIKKIDSLQDSLILAVKTPHETYMQLEDPEDVSFSWLKLQQLLANALPWVRNLPFPVLFFLIN